MNHPSFTKNSPPIEPMARAEADKNCQLLTLVLLSRCLQPDQAVLDGQVALGGDRHIAVIVQQE